MEFKRLRAQIFFFLCFITIALVLFSSPTTSQEVDDEREFNYEEDSERGPHHWGEIREEWKMCKIGTMQSPIDLLDKRVEVVSHLGNITSSYKPSNATLTNRGHDMMLKWEGGAGNIQINGTSYVLQQCHWHSPSEHTINGKKFDLEAHLVHESHNGSIAVIGIMYQIGQPDFFLSSLGGRLEDVYGETEAKQVVGEVDPTKIRINSRKYYKYIGSLTIPPCTQNVLWIINKEVRTVAEEQVKLLRVAVHDESDTNARLLQQINKRSVQLYTEDADEDEDEDITELND